MPLIAKGFKNLLGPLHKLYELGAVAAEDQAYGVLAVRFLMADPVAYYAICLTTTTGTTKANVIGRTGYECCLPGLGGPDYCGVWFGSMRAAPCSCDQDSISKERAGMRAT